jgi:hypothetical protein
MTQAYNISFRTFFVPMLWILYFIISSRLLSRLPVGEIEEVLFLITLLIVLISCTRETSRMVSKGVLSKIFLILLPLIALPFVNAITANKVFGQPYLYGVLAQRQHFMILSSWFIIIQLKRGMISLERLEKYFVASMIVMLLIMYLFYVFIDPNTFSGTDFVKLTANKGWIYKFPNGITAGLLIYCCIQIVVHSLYRYTIPFIATIWYFVYYAQDRSQLAFIALTVLFLYLTAISLRKKALYALYGISGLMLGLILLSIFNNALLEKYIELYTNASAIFTGSSSVESSTNIRFDEAAIAKSGIEDHPWMGNGFLSNRWEDGYFQFYHYFYPSDVGILGNLYVFGIIGTIIQYIPFIAVFIWAFKLRRLKDPFLLTSIYTMIFLFFDMLTAANNLMYIALPAFFFGIVYYYRYHVLPEAESLNPQE